METTKFKTNLKCSGCVDKVTPYLDDAVGKTNWSVDLNAPVKVLTIEGEIAPVKVIEALQKGGYKAEKVN